MLYDHGCGDHIVPDFHVYSMGCMNLTALMFVYRCLQPSTSRSTELLPAVRRPTDPQPNHLLEVGGEPQPLRVLLRHHLDQVPGGANPRRRASVKKKTQTQNTLTTFFLVFGVSFNDKKSVVSVPPFFASPR